MKLGGSGGTPLLELPSSRRGPALSLRPGQLVKGVTQEQDGRLLAQIGRLSLPLPRGVATGPGQSLAFQVTATQRGLALRLLGGEQGKLAPATALARRHLPLQQPVGEALRSMATDEALRATLPAAARDALETLLARIPDARSLAEPTDLRTALRDSGALLESLLLRHPEALVNLSGRDLKAALSRLAASLKAERRDTVNSSGAVEGRMAELGRLADAALSRLHLLQLQPTQSEGRVDLAFELPLRDGDDIDGLYLRIREQPDDGGHDNRPSAEPHWDLTVRFSFQSAQGLEARLQLQGERLSMTWWTESQSLAAELETWLPSLGQRIEAFGLTVAHLSARHGQPAPLPRDTTQPPEGGLVDERA